MHFTEVEVVLEGLTAYEEANALLLALEPEMEWQARELVEQMPDGALKYLRLGAEVLVRLILVEQSRRGDDRAT